MSDFIHTKQVPLHPINESMNKSASVNSDRYPISPTLA